MPTPMDVMLGLVVAAIGLMSFVIALANPDPRKRMISYVIAGIITAAGFYYYISSGIRGFQMRRRIQEIQQRQSMNLDEIRKRLGENQEQQRQVPPKPAGAKP